MIDVEMVQRLLVSYNVMPKSYREILYDYLMIKNTVVYNYIGERVYDTEDLIEAMSWGEEFAKGFITELIREGDEPGNSYACPWCERYNHCSKCTYADRHIICSYSSSLFSSIMEEVDNKAGTRSTYISSLPGYKELTGVLFAALQKDGE